MIDRLIRRGRLLSDVPAPARPSIYRPGLVPYHELTARVTAATETLSGLEATVPRQEWKDEKQRRETAHRLTWAKWCHDTGLAFVEAKP